jgi:hypothetical protein
VETTLWKTRMENLLRIGIGHRAQQDLQQSAGKISRFVTRVKDFDRFQECEKSVALSRHACQRPGNDRTETMRRPKILRTGTTGRGASPLAGRAHRARPFA